jgi:hypothetical protein
VPRKAFRISTASRDGGKETGNEPETNLSFYKMPVAWLSGFVLETECAVVYARLCLNQM